jgi:hypothetical protein
VNPSDKRFILGIIEEGDKVTRLIDHKTGIQRLDDIVDKEISEDGVNSKRKNEDDNQGLTAKKPKLDKGSSSQTIEGDKSDSLRKERHGKQ